MDFGEVCQVASFVMLVSQMSAKQGIQIYVRRQETYGKTKCNARWLENRKDRLGLHQIEVEISRHAKGTSQRETLMRELHSYQAEWTKAIRSVILIQVFLFQRKSWTAHRSIRPRVDRTSNLLLGFAKRIGDANQSELLIVMELDGQ
ncbi:hypothetical protein BCR43DRAFT_516252 [Syncephalastrum racemosum]|uniref:Uncharacterized protein n=1 Tax=Syncephalastrum racemosum TaxID=13706 RepID=A0A1X2H7P2_SYNRA|nr:hypothetical protein BCR43DRAFT_516252 [Syncephalastrum racemosum]